MILILRGLFTLFMTALTLFAIWGLGWVWFASAIAFGTDNEDPPRAEAIVVLTGGNGRLNEALDLLKTGVAPVVFISGVSQGVIEDDILKSWKNRPTKKICCIELGYNATDTAGNAAEVQEWVNDKDIESIILVTSRYHMPRALMEISYMLPNIQIHKHVTDSDDFKPWEGRFFELTFSEYNKMLVQWLRLYSQQLS